MSKSTLKIRHILAATVAFVFTASTLAWGAATDLATEPLATSSSAVRPNLLFTLDDSGSMGWDYLPDYAGNNVSHCKPSAQCNNGMPPFQAGAYNGVAYNPTVTYAPPVNADGTLKPGQTCANTGGTSCAAAPYTNGWTSVKVDGYGIQSTGTINLLTGYPETVYCSGGGVCKQNGIDTNNPFFEDAT
ncbi:MAG: hypothetical protein PHT15_00660, partial [Gallionellaceae bacterium]|nr:hypothetical protein [Gallionellaceae bacterium]